MKNKLAVILTWFLLGPPCYLHAKNPLHQDLDLLKFHAPEYHFPLAQIRFGHSTENRAEHRPQFVSPLFESGKKWGTGEWVVVGVVIVAVVVVVAAVSSSGNGGSGSGGSGY